MNISLYDVSVWVLPLVIAITFHEAAHGFVAHRLGDDTAWKLGRVSFNPLKHIDPFGTLILPAMLLFAHSPFLFGYAKPVPVNFRKLNHPKLDMVWVALAGPVTNILLAMAAALEARGDLTYGDKGNMTREEIDKTIDALIQLKRDGHFRAFWSTFDESVIESHVSKLRKKLRDRLGFDAIVARRYVGYRLNIPAGETIDVPMQELDEVGILINRAHAAPAAYPAGN